MIENVNNLVMMAQNGDVEAFEKLVETFQDAVFGAVYAFIRNFHDAEEIAQEVFILAYQELPRLREPKKFPGWLRRITITACNRFLHSHKANYEELSNVIETPTDLPGPDDVVEAKELKEQILKQINALSEKNRVVTMLYFINGYSHKEISDFLEVSVSTVKSRLHESRKNLQRRLITMAKEVLHENKPGAEFVQQLKEKLNGKIIELPDGHIQVFYDFVDERQLQDWRASTMPQKAVPVAKEKSLAFGRIEPEQTDNQWDRNIRLNLVLDSDPNADLEIDFNVSMGTNEPWSSAAWVLTRRDGTGPGIRFFYGVLTDYCEEWRQNPERNEGGLLKDGYIRADLLRRRVGNAPEDESWVAPTRLDIPIAGCYHMKVTRRDRILRWEIDDQTIAETELADDELCLMERLMFCNPGKGTGAIFRNVVIRSRILDIDAYWSGEDREKAQK